MPIQNLPLRTPGWWLPGTILVGVGLVALFVLMGIAWLAADAGFANVAWPALSGIVVVALGGALLYGEQRWRELNRVIPEKQGASSAPSDVDLIHLFAGRFARPARGRDSFRPPLQRSPVCAEDAAWRAIAATLLDLDAQEVLELELHALPTPAEPVQVVAVRVVRPGTIQDPFAVRLLHPLTRRGVGASTTVSELVGQAIMVDRHPARTLLESARPHLLAAGYYRLAARSGGGGRIHLLTWVQVLLRRPIEPDPAKLELVWPQVEALEARLAEWDASNPALISALRHEALAAFTRARARAGVRTND
jgi:hypothetical protein